MNSIKDQLSFYGSALQLRGKRNNILASNIANAATPNYKARDISFEDEINKFSKNGYFIFNIKDKSILREIKGKIIKSIL